jgi:GNAT superfamily N-acetyltransferase
MRSLSPPSLRNKIRIGLDILGQLGWRAFFWKVLPWLFCRRYFFYSQPIFPVPVVPPCRLPVTLKRANEDDLPHLTALSPSATTAARLKKRLRDGHLCFIGWVANRPVQYRWVFTRSLYLPYLRHTLVLSPSEVYVDEAYTIPELRGHGIATYTGYLLRLALLELGYGRYTCAVASWNKAQLKLADKFGMDKVGEGGYINLLLGKKFIWTDRVKDHGHGRIEICVSD